MLFPADVEEDAYGSFFGPLTQKYGGIRSKIIFGEGKNPFAGLGFNLVNSDKDGGDISSMNGVCINYQSRTDFALEIVVANDGEITKNNNYKVIVPKSMSSTRVTFPWAKFQQNANQSGTIPQEEALKNVATIQLVFTSSTGSEAEFSINAIGGYADCMAGPLTPGDTSFVSSDINDPVEYKGPGLNYETPDIQPPPSNTDSKYATVFWNGKQDTDGRIPTLLGDGSDTEGYWYSYTDSDYSEGLSEIHYPNDVREDDNGNFFGPMFEAYGGIQATIELNENKDLTAPYAGFGFNITGEDQTAADITSWGGVCLAYKSKLKFQVKVTPENAPNIAFESAVATVPAVDTLTYIDIPWSKFRCSSGWGCPSTAEDFVSKAATVRLDFTDTSSAKGEFFLQQFGALGLCGPDKKMTESIPSVQIAGQAKAILQGRKLIFKEIKSSAKVTITNLRGQTVAKATVSGNQSISLDHLQAGIYMVKVNGMAQKIIVK